MIPDHIKAQAFALLGCQPAEARLLGGYDNNVYEINRGGEPIVVKLLDRSKAAESQVRAEMEWLEYLVLHGLKVARPIRLIEDTYIKPISDDIYCIAYHKVNGGHIDPQDNHVWNYALFEQWGELMGKLHVLAKTRTDQAVHPLRMITASFMAICIITIYCLAAMS
ncbi:phosphotransferase [Paenibacillus spongiae]|uniref:Phosphotransferase n=1 Tax=Paenibacillus spongiae TaxID=2909671 RepID=A0ABY5S6B0_9BACL|nr:phosphotransferase [Paenibacillus spongiae]UVI29446.1 phosphotransferase [Paenibacillus spongiae]